jgi:hypothetical protein
VIHLGFNVSTPQIANFSQGFDSEYTTITMNGDGTCGIPSLELCGTWSNQQKQPVQMFPIPNMCHACAMFNVPAISVFLKVLGV